MWVKDWGADFGRVPVALSLVEVGGRLPRSFLAKILWFAQMMNAPWDLRVLTDRN